MAHWKTISGHEHGNGRLDRLCKMKKFTDNFLRNPSNCDIKIAIGISEKATAYPVPYELG